MVANVIFEISNFRLVAPSDLSDLSDLSDKKLVDLLTRRLPSPSPKCKKS